MRIVGIIFFGAVSIFTGVLLIVFLTFYISLFQTDYLFKEYNKAGVYSKVSNAIQAQIAGASEENSDSGQNQIQNQVQQKIVQTVFSEKNIQRTVENNITRFKEFEQSKEQSFSPYLPFSDKSETDTLVNELGFGELANDPQFQQIISQVPQKMMGDGNALQSIAQGANNLKSALRILKYVLPIVVIASLGLFILLGRGIGRLKNLGILFILIAIAVWILFFFEKLIFAATIQNPSFTSGNLGTELASLIIAPIFTLALSLVAKSAIFVTFAGILFIGAWIILRMNEAKSVPKHTSTKKHT